MKIDEYFAVKDQGEREIGIEIEMEGSALFPAPNASGDRKFNYWNVTGDGSLRPNPEAAEYVLNTPILRNRLNSRLEYLVNALAKQGAQLNPSDRCGVHIHVNVQSLDMAQFFRLCTMYFLFEPLLTRWCGEDREGNLFCLRAADAEYLIQALIEAKMTGILTGLTSRDMRYSAMNLDALRKYGSVEFRTMRTPANLLDVAIWAKMLLSLKDAAISARTETSIIEDVSRLGEVPFAAQVFGKQFRHLASFDVIPLVRKGLDLAQNVAYVPIHASLLKEGIKKKRHPYDLGVGPARVTTFRPRWAESPDFSDEPRTPEPMDSTLPRRARVGNRVVEVDSLEFDRERGLRERQRIAAAFAADVREARLRAEADRLSSLDWFVTSGTTTSTEDAT